MRILLASLLLLLPQTAELPKRSLNLEPMLNDSEALKRLKILYQNQPRGNHGSQSFFVSGDGSLVMQAHPQQPLAENVIATCRNKVSPDQVREMFRLIIQRHFSDLPQRSFFEVFMGYPMAQDLEVYTIAIDDGFKRENRDFGIGTYAGKEESLPADFAAIAEQLKHLKELTVQKPEKPCHLAPAINFWK